MSRGAQISHHISHPPPHDLVWSALRYPAPGRDMASDFVTARTWFEARAKALVALQCEPWELAPLRADPFMSNLSNALSAAFR